MIDIERANDLEELADLYEQDGDIEELEKVLIEMSEMQDAVRGGMPQQPVSGGFDSSTARPVEQSGIPDQPAQQSDSFAKNSLDVLSELAAANNRTVTEFIDFVGPDTVNALLNVTGFDARMPTLTGALESTGIQGGFMEPGTARDIVQTAGQLIPAAAGLKQVPARDLTKAAGAAAEFFGAGSAAVTQPIARAGGAAVEAVQDIVPSKAKAAAKLPLLRRSGDVAAAGFKLDDAGKVIGDKVQKKALSAGLDDGAVSMIASSNKATKSRIKDMVNILEKGKKNLEFRNFNPPQKVVGEAIGDRLKIIQTANKQAARQLEGVANSLKGKPVDVSPAVNTFIDDLQKQGIGVDINTGKLDFTDSIIEGENLNQAQGIIQNVFNRIYKTGDPSRNAYRVHTAKGFIDEQVTFGKSPGGLSGKMDGIVKRLRHNLDGVLDSTFPEYDKVNSTYSETRRVIDDIQSLAGRKVDLTGSNVDKALGTMSRKVLSNYNTGVAMEDLFKVLDDVSRRYSTPLTSSVDDELFKLISAEAEIRKMFPTAIKPNTFQGQIGVEATRAAGDIVTGNKIGLAARVGRAAGKVFSKDEESKLKALRDLVSE